MESLVRDSLVTHMMDNSLFCDAQHGFAPGHSCMTQLLVVLEQWTDMLDRGEAIDTVYLDFQKAFDSVPYKRLLTKLEAYGIKGRLKSWISSFLSGRRQRVVVNGSLSSWAEVLSGIPQGSVLGPILFVLFINDLPDVVASTSMIFADDTKIFCSISNDKDAAQLQQDLNNLADWSQTWQLKFNASKCHVMHLGKQTTTYKYTMGGSTLEETEAEKDLGVIIDNELKFHSHVAQSVLKANRMLGLIKATFSCLDEYTLPRLYQAMVRPHLEYGNIIWHPRFKCDAQAVEKVQRRATKLVPSIKDLSYEDRLQHLKLPSLQHRRLRGDLIQVFKIFKGLDRVDPDIFFSRPRTDTTRGHEYKLFKKHCKLDVRRNTFSHRIVNSWNNLSERVVQSPSLNCFKSRLDKHLCEEQYNTPW